MKIAILSRNPESYSVKRLIAAGKTYGHKVDVIDTLRCFINITSAKPSIHYFDQALLKYDAVIPRIGSSITFYGAAIVRQFETMGTFCLNSSVAITRSRDKLRASQLLARKQIDLPITGFSHSLSDAKNLIRMLGGAPLIVKLLEGTQGVGVILAETSKTATSIIEAFFGLKTNIMIQEYIEESNGADIRCFVVGNKVVAAMERKAVPGEFRANIHQGGTAKKIDITAE